MPRAPSWQRSRLARQRKVSVRCMATGHLHERNRNLFYVVYSSPKTRLALLFIQLLSPQAFATFED